MGRRRNPKIRKIQQTGGGTYVVSLPINVVRELGWREHQRVVAEFDSRRKRIIIKDYNPQHLPVRENIYWEKIKKKKT